MTNHWCPWCGFELDESGRQSWVHRHPFCATVFGVPTMFTAVSVTLAYPWIFIPVLIVAAPSGSTAGTAAAPPPPRAPTTNTASS